MNGAEVAIDFGRWLLTIAVTVFFVSMVLKTKWWRNDVGINMFLLALTFMLTVIVINLRVYDVLQPVHSLWLFAFIYSAFGIVLVWRAITIWFKNEGFWAWTKD